MITEFHWLNCGYCKTPGKATYTEYSWRIRHYKAWFGLMHHERFGWILFDTGYSEYYEQAVSKFPGRLLNWIVPVTVDGSLTETIAAITGSIEVVNTILVSHLHADHIGGLKCFQNAKFIMHEKAVSQAENDYGFKALHHGFLRSLLPDDWAQRTESLKFNVEGKKVFERGVLSQSYLADVFGDGSVMAIQLPGHSKGMYGVLFKYKQKDIFLCADALYHIESLDKGGLGFAQKMIGGDKASVVSTYHLIKQIHRDYPEMLFMPSHCDTAAQQFHQL